MVHSLIQRGLRAISKLTSGHSSPDCPTKDDAACAAAAAAPASVPVTAAAPVQPGVPGKRKLLIAGWRGISHSYAMVNQYQILALSRRNDVELSHVDMPMFMAHWNKRDHQAGFSATETAFIDSLPPAAEEDVDCVLRICAPLTPPDPRAHKTLTFAVTELGYSRSDMKNPDLNVADFTAGGNLIVTPSRWARDRLIDFGFDEGRVRVLRHGADLATLRPLSDEELAAQRQSLGIPADAVVFLNVGVPTWNKGIDMVVRAFAALHRTHRNVRLILKDARGLYGLPVDTVLQSVAKEFPGLLTPEVLANIMVIPTNLSQAELRLLYGFVDWYVSPYRAEGFNLPVLECQACGTPVIASSGGATDDYCNTPAVRKIPTVFRRGVLNNLKECCWLDPEYAILENMLRQAAMEGPRRAADTLRQAARANAAQYTWDSVATILMGLV